MAIHLLNPRSLYRLADGMHTDGGGLYLRVQKNGQSRTWAFRFQRKGKRVQVSLGSLADVTITDARQLSKQLNRCLVAGDDPVEYLKSLTAEAQPLTDMTFAGLLPYALKSVEDRKLWKNAKSKMQWENTLSDYALPKLGRKDIDTITSKGWRFSEGQDGIDFVASVEDEDFLGDVKSRKIKFENGTGIRAVLRTVQRKNIRTVTDRTIVEVKEVIPPSQCLF